MHMPRYTLCKAVCSSSSLTTSPPASHLDSRILLRKRPPQILNTVRNPLEIILLLRINLLHRIRSSGIVVLIRPLDFEGVEVEFRVVAVEVFGLMAREAAEGGDKAHELVHVVPTFVRVLVRCED